MAAYRLTAWGRPPALVEAAVPMPGPGEVRVRVAGCGLCHSDVTMARIPASVGEALGWSMPFTLGHETAGWIDAVGPSVDGGWVEGTPVALASPSSCGRCRWCLRGQENACPNGTAGRGYGRDGGLAAHVLVSDPRGLLALGDLDPRRAGPLTDAGATSMHAVRRVQPHLADGSVAVVLGVGGLGAYVVQILRATTTARVIALDPSPVRRQVAMDLGAHDVLDGVGTDTDVALRELVGPSGAEAVIDLVGIDDTISTAISALGPGGALGVVGAAGGTLRRPWYGSLPRDDEVFTFQGSDLGDARAVIELAAAGAIIVPTEAYGLDSVVDAFAALEAGTLTGRAVVQPVGT